MFSTIEQLQAAMRAILPGARLAPQSLPDAPEIKLLLLAQDYPQRDLSQQEMVQVMDNPLYWIFCWASGQVLARYLLDQPELVRGRRVLDFGCGSGVAGIAAALAGARDVVACDIDPLALAATRVNAAGNNVNVDLCGSYFEVAGDIDLVIVADVLYDRGNFDWLQRFLERANEVLIADSRVKDFDVPPYRQVARMDGCTIPDLDESAEFRDVRIYCAP